ncbi:hypothetical protein [Roseimicrobium sp. ORNL1]|uniref:hypothetical protein n=1 Tax=Roseimicrobium sp. ORNL1 TaxID=2711231 RepID=UPI0013E19578|nr:hypothetical protein [Roseimicrobium sp. ORNL1]QIF00529.1 hypothetical protein G5S37_03005 [Roseimicrobium sp. ORNL1]
MKTNCFFTIATALGLSLAVHAQQPGPDQDRPKDPPAPPVSRPDARPDAPRRDSDRGPDRGPGQQAGPDMQRHHQHAASTPDRDAHIREALKHLREAGLGDVAQRLERAIGERRLGNDRRDGQRRDVAEGRRVNPPGPAAGSDARRPDEFQQRQHRRHHNWAEQGRREGGDTFASPQRIPNPRPDSARGPERRPDAARGPEQRRDGNAGTEELRGQVQRLTREVEALKNALKQQQQQRTHDGPREQFSRPDEPKREDHRSDGPRGEERRPDAPRSDARREGPPVPPRDGAAPNAQPEGRRID